MYKKDHHLKAKQYPSFRSSVSLFCDRTTKKIISRGKIINKNRNNCRKFQNVHVFFIFVRDLVWNGPLRLISQNYFKCRLFVLKHLVAEVSHLILCAYSSFFCQIQNIIIISNALVFSCTCICLELTWLPATRESIQQNNQTAN